MGSLARVNSMGDISRFIVPFFTVKTVSFLPNVPSRGKEARGPHTCFTLLYTAREFLTCHRGCRRKGLRDIVVVTLNKYFQEPLPSFPAALYFT
jgi:hypothetical protein